MTEPSPLDYWRGRPVVYRISDATGRLIYVGASRNWPGRIRNHESATWWWELAAKLRLQVLPSWEAARAAECVAIQEEQPAFNIHHTGRRGRPSRMTPADIEVLQRWVDRTDAAGFLPLSLRPLLRRAS